VKIRTRQKFGYRGRESPAKETGGNGRGKKTPKTRVKASRVYHQVSSPSTVRTKVRDQASERGQRKMCKGSCHKRGDIYIPSKKTGRSKRDATGGCQETRQRTVGRKTLPKENETVKLHFGETQKPKHRTKSWETSNR